MQAEHAGSAHALDRLHRDLVRYQGGAADGLASFKRGVDEYAARMTEHFRREDALFELSRAVIGEEDWARIAAAFDENDDPLSGNSRRSEFGPLYLRIVVLAPRKIRQRYSAADVHG